MKTVISLRRAGSVALSLLALVIWQQGAEAQDQGLHLGHQKARVHKGIDGEPLTVVSRGSGNCTTTSSGTCSINSPTMRTRISSVRFEVTAIDGQSAVETETGVSNPITISQP